MSKQHVTANFKSQELSHLTPEILLSLLLSSDIPLFKIHFFFSKCWTVIGQRFGVRDYCCRMSFFNLELELGFIL